MNVLDVGFMSFTDRVFEQTWDDRLLGECNRKIRRCGNHGNSINIGMMTTVIDI